ncbi:UNVERIFIED_ORG: phage repressor protein C with HTH and peptisase S24 domain [Xanthobacter viscosus]|uniref:Helix-turn-helix transcriptional regulator n=1 Tax=Xanthobacter autotrophicus TaxID=280 RepID=A0A6C1KJ79_XANAU|nr:S24 family peptidase [Xanthobacter autotrophicus]TLX43881.1 helix-turn-helix transcriptional regulator [Xanthobacter autotrophicus]
MDAVRQLIIDRVNELGTDLKAASLAMGRNHAYLQQFISRGVPVELKERDRIALATFLRVEEGRLRPQQAERLNAEPQRSPKPERPKADVSYPMDVNWPTRKVPVYGQAAGGADDDGRFILNGNKVADVLILPGLEDVKDAYAVYVYGTSMVPAFKPGATVYVDPSRPIVAGDDVVVQVKMDEHEPPYGFVKEFVARRGGKLVLLQHNPPEGQDKTLTFPLDRVVAVHKVVGNVPR